MGIIFSDKARHLQIKSLLDKPEGMSILNRLQAGRVGKAGALGFGSRPRRLSREELEILKDEWIYFEAADDGCIYAAFRKPVNEIRAILGLPPQDVFGNDIIETESLKEAVDFKDIEAKKIFNRTWRERFNELLAGKEIHKVTKTSRLRFFVEKVFIGAKSGNLFIEVKDAFGRADRFSIIDFGDISTKKDHLECKDQDLQLQIISAVEAYKNEWNEAAKIANSRNRGEEGRIKRTKRTADAVLKSPRCEWLKAWLADKITDIYFKLPICSDTIEVVLDDTLEPEEFEKIAEKWQFATDKFLDLWTPALVEGVDFDYRDAVEEPETISAWYKFRGPACVISFKCDLNSSEIPEEITEMIALAKLESEEAGVDRAINYDVKGNKLDSYYFGRALGEIFDYNINFYKNTKPVEPEKEEENPFEQEFDSINAYGEKVESLKEAAEKTFTCCICGEESTGYGNNPEPFKHEGRCCDACNLKFVIPARLEQVENSEEK